MEPHPSLPWWPSVHTRLWVCAVVRREEELLFLRSHYNVEDFCVHESPQTRGTRETPPPPALSCLLHPHQTPPEGGAEEDWYDMSLLPFLLIPPPPHTSHPHKPHTITTALADMVPVRWRRQVVYPDRERLGVNQPLPQVLEEKQHPFALYHFNRKLSLEPKTVINSRVVVVGASDTSLSLLESLVFCPHLSFSNLSLLSPSGLPTHSLPLLGLSAWVHTVPASLIAINREEKEVVVWGGGEEGEEGEEGTVPYDLLILATGLQFAPPPLTSDPGETPLIYHDNDGLGVLEWTQQYLLSQEVLIYGSGLEALTTLQSLLTGGVDPSLITFVRPRPHSCFNSRTVEERVQRSLEESGVQLLTGHTLSSVEEGGVSLLDGDHTLFAHCQGLICMEEKEVTGTVFTAVNDSCLVFDERLVVDRDHQTNDPAILAAGPMTKFSRSYHSNHWTHANFNSREVGQKLAASLLSRLDPTYQEPSATSDPALLPTYTQPKAVYTVLPGGLHYLHVDKPHPSDPTNTLTNQTGTGHELETDTENGYFRLFINQYSSVQTITVLSSQAIERTNYLCLYGLHEKYLNNLLSRYSEGLISDLFTFLREPWTCAVYHDRFSDLREEVRETLSLQQLTPGGAPSEVNQHQPAAEDDGGTGRQSVEERVRQLLTDQQTVSLEEHKDQLLREFSQSPSETGSAAVAPSLPPLQPLPSPHVCTPRHSVTDTQPIALCI
ncbi:Cilia- and flagella-associated protein 61 [Geodia barretti]|uniref:Cilia- and flagella-associated protein 61 n=1 Tax=Geodia barretti TaxID=519541 RepID=A0AA35T1C2_GEOBA|nr:Cilia- and flagella-associated protein 61 [Geodia barretti]